MSNKKTSKYPKDGVITNTVAETHANFFNEQARKTEQRLARAVQRRRELLELSKNQGPL